MDSTALLLNPRYISFPFLLWSFFAEVPDPRHFIITGSLLSSSIQASFFLPWLVVLGIRREACRCYWQQNRAQVVKLHGWNSGHKGDVWMLCKTKSFEPLLQPCSLALLGHGISFLPAHSRWTENHWNISGVHTNPRTTMKMAQHQVDITLAWTHYRKSCLRCCFQDNYINTHFFCYFWQHLYIEQLLYFIPLFLWVFHILSFVLVGFISISLKQCRNWLATGNSFQNNIGP